MKITTTTTKTYREIALENSVANIARKFGFEDSRTIEFAKLVDSLDLALPEKETCHLYQEIFETMKELLDGTSFKLLVK